MKRCLILLTISLWFLISPLCEVGLSATPSNDPLRAAIFIQNRADDELSAKLDMLNDQITTRLTDKGFSIIDRSLVLAKFGESGNRDPSLTRTVATRSEVMQGSKPEGSVEDALSGASALRIAQMIGADYLVIASINSIGMESRIFKGEGTVYGSDNQTDIYTLRISLKVLEGNSGGTVYGDTVSVSERVSVGKRVVITSSDIINKLVEKGAMKIAGNIADKTSKIRDVKVTTAATVEFTVSSNVEDASVELDGAAIGSTPGRFMAPAGIHQLRITKQWFSPWEKTVNIFSGQAMNVSLELSREGISKFETIERLKNDLTKDKMRTELEGKEREASMGISKEQSEADAYSKKAIADAEKKKLEESYERLDGAPAPKNN